VGKYVYTDVLIDDAPIGVPDFDADLYHREGGFHSLAALLPTAWARKARFVEGHPRAAMVYFAALHNEGVCGHALHKALVHYQVQAPVDAEWILPERKNVMCCGAPPKANTTPAPDGFIEVQYESPETAGIRFDIPSPASGRRYGRYKHGDMFTITRADYEALQRDPRYAKHKARIVLAPRYEAPNVAEPSLEPPILLENDSTPTPKKISKASKGAADE
jgi:hypothetical protein